MQIGVSLYLLYLQVGVAFMAGLVFAILLIPLNRYVCTKIGELSTTMMKRKDARVKVMSSSDVIGPRSVCYTDCSRLCLNLVSSIHTHTDVGRERSHAWHPCCQVLWVGEQLSDSHHTAA